MATNLYKKIKELREQNEFSQEYLAKKLGVSRPTYMQIEKGERELTISEAKKLADVFGLSLESFLDGSIASPQKVTLEADTKSEKENDIRIIMPHANVKKFKEVLLYVLGKVGAKPNIGETALYKLLYFIDFDYYEKFEEQLLGATYIKNHFGPTPIEFKKIVENLESKGELETIKSKYFQHEQTKYLPRRSSDISVLNAQEIKHIDEVLERLADKSATELSEYSHKDVPWLGTEDGKIINYESVFYRTPETSVRIYGEG